MASVCRNGRSGHSSGPRRDAAGAGTALAKPSLPESGAAPVAAKTYDVTRISYPGPDDFRRRRVAPGVAARRPRPGRGARRDDAAAAAALPRRQLVERRRQPGAARPQQRQLHQLSSAPAAPRSTPTGAARPAIRTTRRHLRHALHRGAGHPAARAGDLRRLPAPERRRRARAGRPATPSPSRPRRTPGWIEGGAPGQRRARAAIGTC